MKIGIAGPVDLNLLNINTENHDLANDFPFPMYSHFVNNLLKRGHTVVVFTLSAQLNQNLVFNKGNLTVCISPLKPQPGRRFFDFEIRTMSNLIRKYKPDITHALWSYEFALAALKTSQPCVITLQDHATTILKLQFDAYRAVRWVMNYLVLKRSKHLIANSKYLFDLLTAKQKGKTRIIHNFYSTELEQHFEHSEKKANYILSISNGFRKRKNIHSGILAFSKLRKKYPNIEYRIVGINMEEGGWAHHFAVSNNAAEGIKFIGKIPFQKVIEEIKHAKIVLHPSLEESFGMSVLEPLVIGTPVVGGKNSGNVPFLLSHGRTGRVCDVANTDDIVREVSYLLDNEDVANEIRKTAFDFAKKYYSEDVIVDQHIEFYNEIILEEKPE